MLIQKNINLKELTTIRLGGKAKFFVDCKTREEIIEAIKWAKRESIPFFVLSGGSNTIFEDIGFNGLIIKISTKGTDIKENQVTAQAGENWDSFVATMIANNLQGVECLSGIPGSVGAVPIQNIGAYGQDVSSSIIEVEVFDCKNLKIKKISNQDCQFEYRNSLFKNNLGKYVILSVTFEFYKSNVVDIKYESLASFMKENNLSPSLQNTRQAVISLRKSKSMVLNDNDPNSRSCGSFFMNPTISKSSLEKLLLDYPNIPFHASGQKYKIPAAWLIEQSGFQKGYRYKTVGISTNHTLALVSRKNSTTKDLLELQALIQEKVQNQFGIKLEREPILVN